MSNFYIKITLKYSVDKILMFKYSCYTLLSLKPSEDIL